ncbi:uncharacterized protein [Zea mays]|uniref:uncharacterized protein n=1 Tax=Zea mays TaxID=4577 RepID=UPI0004DEA387|nr:uncharacterized protein LOC103626838 [Zea mays]|eukprot:XP_008645405.1 uncharacterized protein LOC103626838 [Zea mays]
MDENIEIDVYKNDIMEHARDLWNNWRGDLSRHYVKPTKNMQQAIKNCLNDFAQADWEWLVKEHFCSKEFIAKSKRNSRNRSNLTILHHSGSKPFRKVIYDNGGKDNNPLALDALFFMTHTKGDNFIDSESSSKHAQIQEQMLSDPSLSNAQLMDKCFPSKR